MELIITYSIKASLAMALFYCLHMLLFRSETFFKLRRVYFLFALVFSLIFPFISLSWEASSTSALSSPVYTLSEIEVFVDGQMQSNASPNGIESLSLFQIVVTIASLGALFLCGRFIAQLAKLIYHLQSIKTKKIGSYRIIEIDNGKCSSFSFFHWIVINASGQTASQLEDIVDHERIHAKQWHSIDVLLYEVFCVLFWWSPFAWMMKNDMKLNLEYLADAGVLQDKGDYKDYQYALLQISTANSGMTFINNFNILHLKKRISMMNKKRSSFIRSAKFLLAAPLALALLLGNVVRATPSAVENIEATEVAVQLDVDQTPKKVEETPKKVVQTPKKAEETPKKVVQTPKKTEGAPKKGGEIPEFIEVMPRFPGGEEKMMEFIGKNITYPVVAQEAGITGRVVVRFVVQADGTITDARVMRGFSKGNKKVADSNETTVVGYVKKNEESKMSNEEIGKMLDNEALRVVNAMPKWTPGKEKGEPVAVYFNLPIVFRITKDAPKVESKKE